MPEPKKQPESSEPSVDLDTFVTTDDVEAAWVNGLMVWLAPRGGLVGRPLTAWRALLSEYQNLR